METILPATNQPLSNPTPTISSKTTDSKKSVFYLLLVLAASFASGIGGYYLGKNAQNGSFPSQVACTMEAKICPDGSAVGRSGPNCEFAQCPGLSATKQYTNDTVGIAFLYPSNWYIKEDIRKNADVNFFSFLLDPEDITNVGPSYTAPISIAICANFDSKTKLPSPCTKSIQSAIADERTVMTPGSTVTNIVVDGRESVVLEGTYSKTAGPLADQYIKNIYVPWVNGYFLILSTKSQQYLEVMDQIQSSFQSFTPSNMGTREINTFTNNEYGFTFEYPRGYAVSTTEIGWPGAIAIVHDKIQSYLLVIQVAKSAAQYKDLIEMNSKIDLTGTETIVKRKGDLYFLLTSKTSDPKIQQVVSSFKLSDQK